MGALDSFEAANIREQRQRVETEIEEANAADAIWNAAWGAAVPAAGDLASSSAWCAGFARAAWPRPRLPCPPECPRWPSVATRGQLTIRIAVRLVAAPAPCPTTTRST